MIFNISTAKVYFDQHAKERITKNAFKLSINVIKQEPKTVGSLHVNVKDILVRNFNSCLFGVFLQRIEHIQAHL